MMTAEIDLSTEMAAAITTRDSLDVATSVIGTTVAAYITSPH